MSRPSGSVRALEQKLSRLSARVSDLEAQMRSLVASSGRVGGASAGKRTLFKNPMRLSDALAKLLKGRTMHVAEIAEAVQKAGYRTISQNFRIQVRGVLNNGRFKRVARGRYTAK